MNALAAPTTALADLRRLNTDAARLMADANLLLIERLATAAMQSQDLEFVRKVSSDFTTGSTGPEKREATRSVAEATTAVFNLIRDRSVPQVPPPARKRLVPEVQDVEDAVILPSEPNIPDESDVWGAF